MGECGGFSVPDEPAWREWSDLTRQAVQKAWTPPVSARRGASGIVLLHARIRPDGTVHDVVVIKERATPGMVHAATRALTGASPLLPLPPASESSEDGIELTYLFSYNVSDKAACRFLDRWHP